MDKKVVVLLAFLILLQPFVYAQSTLNYNTYEDSIVTVINKQLLGLKMDSNNSVLNLNIANNYLAINELDKAELYYLKVIDLDSCNFDAYYNYTEVLYNQKRFPELRDIAAKATDLNQTNSNIYNRLGLAQYKLDMLKYAIACFNNSIYFDSLNFKPYRNLATVYDKYNDNLYSLELRNKAIKLGADGYIIYFDRAANKYKLKDTIGAKKDFAKGMEYVISDSSDAYLYRGNIYNNLGLKKLASKDYNKAHALDSLNENYYFEMAFNFQDKNQNKLATLYLNQVLKINPSSSFAYFQLGETQANKLFRNTKKIISYYDTAISLYKKDYRYYHNRGVTYYYKSDYSNALMDLIKTNELNKYDYLTNYYLYKIYTKQKAYNLAYHHAYMLHIISPDFYQAYSIAQKAHKRLINPSKKKSHNSKPTQ